MDNVVVDFRLTTPVPIINEMWTLPTVNYELEMMRTWLGTKSRSTFFVQEMKRITVIMEEIWAMDIRLLLK